MSAPGSSRKGRAAVQAQTSRADLLWAVEKAARKLERSEDRVAVWHFAQQAEKVAAGAWMVDSCRCPSSAVGIDRFRSDAQCFASEFDYLMGATPDDPVVFTVVGDASASAPKESS